MEGRWRLEERVRQWNDESRIKEGEIKDAESNSKTQAQIQIQIQIQAQLQTQP